MKKKKDELFGTAFLEEDLKRKKDDERLRKIQADQQSAIRGIDRGWKKFSKDISAKFSGVAQQDRVLVFRQLSQMVVVGIPITQCIEAIRNQAANKKVMMILADVHIKITSGVSFSSACSYHPELFLPMYVPLLKSGEMGGNLDIILDDIANHAEEQLRVQRNIINNLTYPVVAIIVAAIVLLIIFFFCFPGFIEIFKSFHMKLPLITRLAIGLYDTATNPFIVLTGIAGIITLIYLWRKALKKSRYLRLKVDETKLYLPIIGGLQRKIALAAFCRAFVLLYKSGVSFIEIFKIVPAIVDNAYMQESINGLYKDLVDGMAVSQIFKALPFAPPILSQSMVVAEETGNLEILIPKVAEIFERDAEYTTEKILQLMEPIAVMAISGVVFIIILAVFLPLLQIMQAFSNM
jgi:type IV pilus assembly protein PilC